MMNRHILFALVISVGITVEGAPQHRFWPINIAYGSAFEDVPKISALDAASESVIDPTPKETVDAPSPIQDDAFTLSAKPAIEASQVQQQQETLTEENQMKLAMMAEVWQNAARNLFLRPDLLRWISSLTPEMLEPKRPAENKEKSLLQSEPAVVELIEVEEPVTEVVTELPIVEEINAEIVTEQPVEIIVPEPVAMTEELLTEVEQVEKEVVAVEITEPIVEEIIEEPIVEVLVENQPEIIIEAEHEIINEAEHEIINEAEPEIIIEDEPEIVTEAQEIIIDSEPKIMAEEEPSMILELPSEIIVETQPEIIVEQPQEAVVAVKDEPIVEAQPEVIVKQVATIEKNLISKPVSKIVEAKLVSKIVEAKPVSKIVEAKPHSKQSFNKVKLDKFKHQNTKKGKNLFEGAPETFLRGFRSPIFPSFSYSLIHIPQHRFLGR